MANHAHLTSSHLFPKNLQDLSVNSDLFPTSSQEFLSIGIDQFPPVPKNYAHFDLFPLVPKDGNWSNSQNAHDLFPLSPLYEGK